MFTCVFIPITSLEMYQQVVNHLVVTAHLFPTCSEDLPQTHMTSMKLQAEGSDQHNSCECAESPRNNRKSVYWSKGTMCSKDYHRIMTARRIAIWTHRAETAEGNESAEEMDK